jgi:hypothetical protein
MIYGSYVLRFIDSSSSSSAATSSEGPVGKQVARDDQASPFAPSGSKATIKKKVSPSATPSPAPPGFGEPYTAPNLQGDPDLSLVTLNEDETEELSSRLWWHYTFHKPNEVAATVKQPLLPCHFWGAVHGPDVSAMFLLQYYPGDCRVISNPLINPLCRNEASYDLYNCRLGQRMWHLCQERREWAAAEGPVQVCLADGLPHKVSIRSMQAAQVTGEDPGAPLIGDYEVRDSNGKVIAVKPLPMAWGGGNPESGLMQHFRWATHREVALKALRERIPFDPAKDKRRFTSLSTFQRPAEYCLSKRIFLQHANPIDSKGPNGLSTRFLHGLTSGLRLIGMPYIFHPFKARRMQAGLSLDGSGILLSTIDIGRGTDEDLGETVDADIMASRRAHELSVLRQFETLAIGPDVRWSNVAPIAPGIEYGKNYERAVAAEAAKNKGDEKAKEAASSSLWEDLYGLAGGGDLVNLTETTGTTTSASSSEEAHAHGRLLSSSRRSRPVPRIKKSWQKKPYPYSVKDQLNLQISRLKPKVTLADKKIIDTQTSFHTSFLESTASTGEQSSWALHYATRDKIDATLQQEDAERAVIKKNWEEDYLKHFPTPSPSPLSSPSVSPTRTPIYDDDDRSEGYEEQPQHEGEGNKGGVPVLVGLGRDTSDIKGWAKRAVLKVSEGELHYKSIHSKQPLFNDPLHLAYGPPDFAARRRNKGLAWLLPPVDDVRFQRTVKVRVPLPKDRSINILFFNNSRGPLGTAVAAAVAGVLRPHPHGSSSSSSSSSPSRSSFLRPDGSIDGPWLLDHVRPDPEAEKVHFAVFDLLQSLRKDYRVLVVPGKIAQESEQAIKLLSGETSLAPVDPAASPSSTPAPGAVAGTKSKPKAAGGQQSSSSSSKKTYAEGIWTGGLPAIPNYLDDPTLLYGAFPRTALGIVVSDCRGIARMPTPLPSLQSQKGARMLTEVEEESSKENTAGANNTTAPPFVMPSATPFVSSFKRFIGGASFEERHVVGFADGRDPFRLTGNPRGIPGSDAFVPADSPVHLLTSYSEDCLAPIPSEGHYYDLDGNKIERGSSGEKAIPSSSYLWLDHSLNEAMAAEIPLLRIRIYTENAADRSGVRREKAQEREVWLNEQREKGRSGRLLMEESGEAAETGGSHHPRELAAKSPSSTPPPTASPAPLGPQTPVNPYWSEGVTGTTLTYPQPGQEGDYSAREQNVLVDKLRVAYDDFFQKVQRSLIARNNDLALPSPSSTPRPARRPDVVPSKLSVSPTPTAVAAVTGSAAGGEDGATKRALGLRHETEVKEKVEDDERHRAPRSLLQTEEEQKNDGHSGRSLAEGSEDVFRPGPFISKHRGLVATAIDVVQMLCGFGTRWGPSIEQLTAGEAWDYESPHDYV